MTVEEIYSHYQIPSDDVSDEVVTTNYTKTAIKRMKKQTVALKEQTQSMVDYMLEIRSQLVEYVFKNSAGSTFIFQ